MKNRGHFEVFSNFYEPCSESLAKPKGNQGRQTPFLYIWPGADQVPNLGQSDFFDFYEPCSECCEFFAKPKGNAMACKARIVNLKITEKRSFFGELSGGQKSRFFFENMGVQLI